MNLIITLFVVNIFVCQTSFTDGKSSLYFSIVLKNCKLDCISYDANCIQLQSIILLIHTAATVSFRQSSFSLTEAGATFGMSLELSEPLANEITITVNTADITATANGKYICSYMSISVYITKRCTNSGTDMHIVHVWMFLFE